MKKITKLLTVTLMAIVAACACVFALSACGDNNNGNTDNNTEQGGNNGNTDQNNSGGETNTKLDYNFTIVYENNSPVNGLTDGSTASGKVNTQVCGSDGACHPIELVLNLYPDANGVLNLTQAQINELFESEADVTEFVFHVINVKDHKDDCEVAVNGKGDYTVTVTAE